MKTDGKSLSFPLAAAGILGVILALLALACGAVLVLSGLTWNFSTVISTLLYLPYGLLGLVFCLGGVTGLLKAAMTVHLTDDGITVTLLGRIFRQYPIQQLKTFALVQRGLSKSQLTYLCVSTRSPEGLADLQAARTHADDRARELAARRRHSTWQEAFAGDYLRKKAAAMLLTLPGRDLLWMHFHPETLGLLRLAYPQVSWLILPEAQSSPMRYASDSDPATAVFPDLKQIFVFDEAGASLLRKGQRTVVLAADQIRAIVRVHHLSADGGHYEPLLLLTTRTPEELTGEYESGIRRWRGQQALDTLRSLDSWELLALKNACDSRMPLFDPRGKGKDLVSVPWFPAREASLRQRYPQASFFDCSNDALFRAAFADNPNVQILRP